MNKTEQLRQLPSVDQTLQNDTIVALLDQHPRPVVVSVIRKSIDRCREGILKGKQIDDLSSAIIEDTLRLLADDQGQSVQRVINATGVLLHTNLGRAPLAPYAIERMLLAAGYANVELNLETGKRNKRGQRVADLLKLLCKSEDAVVVNNCAAATMLVLSAIASGKEVIVSRGQLVEIGGGFRLPDVFRSSGAILREVGTTNRTYVHDYENACCEETGAIIRVHRSNFLQTGFVTEPSIDEMVTAQRPDHVPVIDDLGSGSMHDISEYGLNEPSVHASIASGADLTLFSGDKLFGGPQCGMIVGRKKWIEKLRKNPLMRAMRVDKLTLATLEATIEIHMSGNAREDLPLLKMIGRTPAEIRQQCESVTQMIGTHDRIKIQIVDCQSQVGGGSIPGSIMPSVGIRIDGVDINRLAKRLRLGTPAVQTRIAEEGLILDLRTVPEQETEILAGRIRESLSTLSQGNA